MSRHSLYSTFDIHLVHGVVLIFLWDFETDFLCKILPNFDNLTRCHDSNDPLDGSKLPRGQGGVSILWPKLWKSNIKKIQDGNVTISTVSFPC
jgi:hypothetical protein